jgi:hypothetical protein
VTVADDDHQATGLEEAPGAESPLTAVAGSYSASADKDPGWYSLGENPNDQSYWDGRQWSGVRQWVAGRGWVEGGVASGGQAPGPGQARLSANPYVQSVTAPARRAHTPAPATLSVGVFLTVVAGIALMYGSVGTWIQINGSVGAVHLSASLNGIDQGITNLIGIDGYVTFIGGIVVLVLGGLALSSEERLLVILTTLVTLAVLIIAIYDTVRTVQKIQALPVNVQPHVSVGWGLICVLSSAVLAIVISLARLLGQR